MIESLKDLQKFFKLCREQGVVKADLKELRFEFGDLPLDNRATTSMGEAIDPYKDFPGGVLSEEQLMFYSAGGSPAEDPATKAS